MLERENKFIWIEKYKYNFNIINSKIIYSCMDYDLINVYGFDYTNDVYDRNIEEVDEEAD